MIGQIPEELLRQIHEKLDKNEFSIAFHAEQDILKQGYNWSKEFILNCLKKGKIYDGLALYPGIKERHGRYYCIHKQSLLSSNLILISFLIKDDILVIHISPLYNPV